ncbi:MAG: hypothetical protein H0U74_21650 [Bradymonadaceae bacterium]|nr:hypothetical protein [Lujinxingiaceae bacterium]
MKSWVTIAVLFGLFSALGCSDQYKGTLPPRDRLNYPIGLALHPDGRFLYVVNSNFDMSHREEVGGTVSVIDTETLQILPAVTPYIPSFGGYIKLNRDATRAYVTTRHANEVIVLDVAGQGQALSCLTPGGVRSSDPDTCRVGRVPDVQGGAVLGSDPFGLEVATITRTEANGDQTLIDLVNVSHLRGSQVTTIAFPNGEIGAASMRSAALVAGGNQIAVRPGSLDFYVAGRSTNQVVYFQPYVNPAGQVEAIVRRGAIALSNGIEAVDARGLAFGQSGRRLYVATRRPNTLHVIAIDPNNARHEIVSTISLGGRPSDVVVHSDANGDELVYVTGYNDGIIEVIDPRAGVLVDTIAVGSSPYQLVIDQSPDRCRYPGDSCRGYVSLFNDTGSAALRCDDVENGCGAVAVIDLDPASPTYHQVIAKIR